METRLIDANKLNEDIKRLFINFPGIADNFIKIVDAQGTIIVSKGICKKYGNTTMPPKNFYIDSYTVAKQIHLEENNKTDKL
jgi:hypothetical protein